MIKFLLPYRFDGFHFELHNFIASGKRLLNKQNSTFYLGEGIYSNFSSIYSDVLAALSEGDEEYLKRIMEPHLFEQTIQGLEDIKQKGLRLNFYQSEDASPGKEYVEEEAVVNSADDQTDAFSKQNMSQKTKIALNLPYSYFERDIKIYFEAQGVFGPRIMRNENEGKNYYNLKSYFSGRQYYINPQNLASLYHNQILVLNVYFKSTRKLYLTKNSTNASEDEEGEVVAGSADSHKFQRHMWRFETYTPDLDWVLTDMDDFLKTNPYLSLAKKA